MTESDDPFRFEDEPQPVEKKVDPRATISLIDLIVAVTIAAVISAVWLQSNDAQSLGVFNILASIPWLIVSIMGGTALFLFGRRFLLGLPTDFQPGHWLMCLNGTTLIYFAINALSEFFYLVFKEYMPMSDANATAMTFAGTVPWWIRLAGSVLVSLIFVLAGFVLPVRPAWRILLIRPVVQAFILVTLMVQIAFQFFPWLGSFSGVASILNELTAFLMIVTLAIWDRVTTSDRRDYLHWIGVVSTALVFGFSVVFNLSMFFWRP
ncbi:hypothetical protein GC197_13080 [bacterium]|nr:hypothetical protein [bacterium]